MILQERLIVTLAKLVDSILTPSPPQRGTRRPWQHLYAVLPQWEHGKDGVNILPEV